MSQNLKLDNNTSCVINIREEHWMIHIGKTFHVCDVTTSVDIATPKKYLFIPGAFSHLTFEVEGSEGIVVEMDRAVTVSNNGTELTISNPNEYSSNVSPAKCYKDPTVTNAGTMIYHFSSGSGTNQGEISGRAAHQNELILLPGVKYLFTITPMANSVTTSFHIEWYEV